MRILKMALLAQILGCGIFLTAGHAMETGPVQPACRVVLAIDPRLPSASPAVVREALRIASNWIEVWYRKKVRFNIDRTESVDSYLAAQFQRLPVLDDWKRFPYALDGSDTVYRFVSQQTTALEGESIPVLQSYVPPAVRPLITSPSAAARNLLELYDQKLRIWKSLRTLTGAPFFDTVHFQKHSYWHWERAFESLSPEQVTDHLIITNVMLVDDALSDAPPHSLLRGGLLNGMAEEECPQAVVSTFPILTDIPAVADLRDTTEFSAKDRVLALAHIIAHEFGAHVIQGYKDVYDHDACLAVPTSGLAYRSTLNRLLRGSPCRRDHPLLNRRGSLADRYENLARRYVDIKRYAEAREAVKRAVEIEPNRPLLKQLLRQLEARKDK